MKLIIAASLFHALAALAAPAPRAGAAPAIWELDPLIQRIIDVDPTFYDRFVATGKVNGINGLPEPASHRSGDGPVYPQVVHSEEEYKAYQAAKGGAKVKRGTPRPLWNKQLGTRYTDVKQTYFGDCWLDAALASLAWVNPLQWVESVFTLPVPGEPNTDHALITLHTGPDTKWNSTIDGIFSTPNGKKYSDASSLWWPAAVEFAVQQYGAKNGHPDILDDGGYPEWSLKWLTGYPTTNIDPSEESSSDTLFKQLQFASQSPVLLGTYPFASKLVGSHAYAILWAGYGNPGDKAGQDDHTTKTVLLQNPWGFTLFYKLEDILPDIAIFTYLTNHQSGPPK